MTPAQIEELIQNTVTSAYTSIGFNGGQYQTHSHIAFPAFHSSASLFFPIASSTWFLNSEGSNDMTSVENYHPSQYLLCSKIISQFTFSWTAY